MCRGASPLSSWNWTNGEDHDVGNIFTGRLVLGGGEVGGDLGNITGNLGEVGDNVGGEGHDELGWVLEDLAPGLNSLDVTIHTLAVLEVFWEVLDNGANGGDTLNDISEVLLLEVLDGGGDLLCNIWSVLDAGLDLWKILLLKKTEDETVHEIDDLSWLDH